MVPCQASETHLKIGHLYTLENRNGSWRIELLREGFWGARHCSWLRVTVSLMLCVSAYTYI